MTHPAPHRATSKRITIGVALLVVSMALLAQPALAQKGKMSTPTLACGATTAASIEVLFTAGSPSGAPAGFSLQWMSLADWQANGGAWFLSSDPLLCKGSFSGNAFGHFYNLPAGATTAVNVGDLIFDNPGASSNCADVPLVCDTDYIFRAFSHANKSLQRSEFTADLVCRTSACTDDPGCTFTQGYWKTHGPDGCRTGNNSNEWPVTSLTLGSIAYSDAQLCSILNRPAQGNGLIALAHQAIAAKLNVANGADDTDVAGALAAADALIGALVVPPVGTGSLHPSVTSGLTSTLTSYNEGTIGPGHCD